MQVMDFITAIKRLFEHFLKHMI